MNFYTRRGYLTQYGLSCGYIDTSKGDGNIRIRLEYRDPEYHVKGYEGVRLLFWDSFSGLAEAQKSFRERMKEYRQTHDKEPYKRSTESP